MSRAKRKMSIVRRAQLKMSRAKPKMVAKIEHSRNLAEFRVR